MDDWAGGATGESPALGRSVGQGLRWSMVSTVVARAGAVLSGVILARLLDPRDYGVYTVAFVTLVLLANVNDLGLETTLVRWPGDVAAVAPTAVTVIFGASVALFAAAWAGAPYLARSLSSPEATGIIRLLAVCVVINGAFAVPSGLLTRTFRQDKRALADVAGFVLSTAVTVALAAAGHGAWSLAWGRLVGNTVNGVLHLAMAPVRFRPGFHAGQARALLGAGIPVAGALLCATAVYNVDYVVVGRVIGPVALGLYVMAFNLSSWPVSLFTEAVSRVSVAGFARLQGDMDALRAAFTRSLTLLMAAAAPVCILIAVLAEPLVRFVYGNRWAPAAEALRFLVVLGLVRVAFHLGYDVLVAVGRGRAALAIQLLWLAALVPAVIVGARSGGIRGTGVAHMVVSVTVVVPALLVALRRAGFHPRETVAGLGRPLAGGVVAAALAVAGQAVAAGNLGRLALGGTLGLAGYLAVVAPLRRLLPRRAREPAWPPDPELEQEVPGPMNP